MDKKQKFANYVRNFIFGVEDSLVSTVGLLSGIAYAEVPKQTIFLTGIILIFVEAFSMGVGSFLSEQSAQEYLKNNIKTSSRSLVGALIMFLSYFAAGFIPLFPYLVFSTSLALTVSIVLSLVSLFMLGLVSARMFKTNVLKSAFRMLLVGGIAICAGVLVGKVVKS